MGILSSLFGIGGTGKQATTTKVIQSQIPKELSPFVKEILAESKALYDADIKRGYDPYTALTTAPFTAEQLQAQEDIKGLRGTQAPFIQEALDIQREGAEKFTPEVAQEYMSPYQRAVTDIEKREAQTAFERTARPAFEKRAVDAGGMSGLGTRAGVEGAELQRGQSQLLADIEAKGLQSSFLNAQKQFEQQKAREQQMASNIGRTGPAFFGATLAEAGAAEGVGAERRELAQTGLDEAYFKFLEEQQFPQRTLAQYESSVYGNPVLGTPSRTETTTGTPFKPSMGQNLLGLGLTGLNIYGSGGGFKPGGQFSTQAALNKAFGGKSGGTIGGLSGLPVVRRQSGTQVMSEEDDFEGDVENIKIRERFPYTPPSPTIREPVRGMNKVAELLKQFGVTPPDPEKIRQREQEYASELAKKTQEFETGEETARAKRFERRMAKAKEGNPMARFAAIQKAIQAGVMGEQGLDIVEGMKVYGQEMAPLNQKMLDVTNTIDEEDAAIKAGVMGPQGFDPVTGMEVYGEEMAPLNQKMLDLTNTIDEEDEAIKTGQRKRKHERLINSLKTNKELQERLTALPRKNMRELLADLVNIGSVEKLFSEIDKNEASVRKAKNDATFKLKNYLLNVAKLDAEKIKTVLANYELAHLNPKGFDAALRELGIEQELIDEIRNEITAIGTGEATGSIPTSPRARRDLKNTLESIKNR